jgi:hypothetical protein
MTTIMRAHALLFALLILPSRMTAAAEFYAVPNSNRLADGSINRPWDLQTALYHPPAVAPGDTIWLRGGTYRTSTGPTEVHSFDCTLLGTPANPILIKQYPGEAAVIDGGIQCRPGSGWYQFWNFRITYTGNNRLVRSASDFRPTGLFISAAGVKVINMVIDNSSTPIFWPDSGLPNGDDGEIYGCIMWGGGEYDAYTPPGTLENPWIRGSAIYAQNVAGRRTIADNICFRNFTTGPLLYAEVGQANGFTVEGNISFDPGAGSAIEAATLDNPITSVDILNNYCFTEKPGNVIRLGYQSRSNRNAVVTGNYAAGLGAGTTGLFAIKNWESATIRNNVFFSFGSNKAVASLDRTDGFAGFPFQWDDNSYYALNYWAFITNNSLPSFAFNEWKTATGYDAHSSFTYGAPANVVMATRRNKYDPARSHLVIFNWAGANSVVYDLANAGLKSGDSYEIRDAQNYVGNAFANGTYSGNTISLPLNLTQVAPIYGTLVHYTNSHTPPTFNAFVVQNRGGSSGGGSSKGKGPPPR